VRLDGKWVAITGGSSGIGLAVATQLAERGNRITLVADGRERLSAAAATLRAAGASVDEAQCDIGNAGELDALASDLLARGGPDVLINNAGAAVYRAFEQSSPAEIDRLLAVNLIGHVRLTKLLLAPMIARRSGAISFMASIAATLPITPNATYCAAKHGMIGLSRALRIELKRFGVEVTAVCPGRVATRFFDHETFRQRTEGPETKSAIGADRAAAAAIAAIERNRAVAFVPENLGLATWLFNALPVPFHLLFDRVAQNRMERLYADSR